MTSATTLNQEVYTELEASRLLGVAPSTLRYWLRGGNQGGVQHLPIIRPEPTDARNVTWAEFIEAGWLRAYRKNKVPMHELRRFIGLLRDELGVSYPLANKQPFLSGRQLVFQAQVEAGLDPYWRLVDEQGLLTLPAEMFLDRVAWEGDAATGWRPVEDPKSTVLVQPDIRFGRPAVGGVSTRALFEYGEEGASRQEIADDFGLGLADVSWALAYENAQHAA